MALRPYQNDGLLETSKLWRAGIRKVILFSATGSGKTVVFCEAIKRAVANGKKAMMVVRGKQLVEQASQRLFREGVSHGVRQADHWNKNYGAPVQVCSIDTLTRRSEFPEADLVVVDEAHLFVSDSCVQFMEHYNSQGKFVLSVTATPWPRQSMKHLGDAVVHPITVQELINQGYLVPPRYYAPSHPDLKGVRTQSGDYVVEQLEERMSVLTGDIVGHWKNLAENRPTVAFAVNIKHSLALVAQFNKAGIPAEHIEGDHSLSEREAAIGRLFRGEIKILSNVGVLCTGVDVPFLSCILMARPTKSYNLYIQQAGRGTRISSETGKKDFIILDHAGNILRHGFITEEPEVELEGIKKEIKGPQIHICEKCYVVFTGSVCHACGWSKPIPPQAEKDMEMEEGVLEELKDLPEAVEISIFIKRQKELARRRGYHHGWVYHRVKERYGEEVAETAFPKYRQRSVPWFLR